MGAQVPVPRERHMDTQGFSNRENLSLGSKATKQLAKSVQDLVHNQSVNHFGIHAQLDKNLEQNEQGQIQAQVVREN